MIDNFLAVPGSVVYEQMRSGAWKYGILRIATCDQPRGTFEP
ncbi:MAG: hypothetical protein ACREA0_10995 [bacterium]